MNLVFFLCFLLMLVGLYCVITRKNILKIVIGLTIMEYAANLFIVLIGFKSEAAPPIITSLTQATAYVDPIPQALILTSIVIGLSILTLNVALCIRIFQKYKTYNISEINKLKG